MTSSIHNLNEHSKSKCDVAPNAHRNMLASAVASCITRAWLFVWLVMFCTASFHSSLADDLIPSRSSRQANLADELVLRFKTDARTQSQLVRLGDLVEVVSWGKRAQDDLLEIALAPAPAVGGTQEWTSRDLLRHLELRGVNPEKVRWTGPTTTQLLRAAEPPKSAKPADSKPMTPAYVQDKLIAQAEGNVIQATREYLWLKTGERTQWRIDVRVPPEHAAALAQRRTIESIDGGEAPWTGEQLFVYVYKSQGKSVQVELVATVEPPQVVVVAARPIRRDEVLQADALEYAALPEQRSNQEGDYFHSIEELVGKQTRRSISTGLSIPRDAIGEPIVISSGELIEIESVSGNVSVKTAGRALSGGAVGSLINVEITATRKRLTATVVGPLLARITSGPRQSTTDVAPAAPANSSASARVSSNTDAYERFRESNRQSIGPGAVAPASANQTVSARTNQADPYEGLRESMRKQASSSSRKGARR